MKNKILVIEDNEQDQKIVKRFLSKEGFDDITFVDCGEDGVNKAKEEKPEIVITDTNLPGINGFQACKAIKEIKELKTKVIVVTGFIDAVDAEKARKMGADDYCVKTSDCAPLIEALRNVLK